MDDESLTDVMVMVMMMVMMMVMVMCARTRVTDVQYWTMALGSKWKCKSWKPPY